MMTAEQPITYRPARALPKRRTHTVHAMAGGAQYALCGARVVIWSQGFTFRDLLPTCSKCKTELRKGERAMTEILCPPWCAGDCQGVHESEFEGVQGTEPDEEVDVRLSQGRDDVPVIELGANDGLKGSALLAMSLGEARKLRDLIDGLLYQATGEEA